MMIKNFFKTMAAGACLMVGLSVLSSTAQAGSPLGEFKEAIPNNVATALFTSPVIVQNINNQDPYLVAQQTFAPLAAVLSIPAVSADPYLLKRSLFASLISERVGLHAVGGPVNIASRNLLGAGAVQLANLTIAAGVGGGAAGEMANTVVNVPLAPPQVLPWDTYFPAAGIAPITMANYITLMNGNLATAQALAAGIYVPIWQALNDANPALFLSQYYA